MRTSCAVVCGHRGKEDQEHAYLVGASNANWPDSRHNSTPSEAVDLVPAHLDWDNIEAFRQLNTVVQSVAAELGLDIEWGGDFTKLKDYDHWQLKR